MLWDALRALDLEHLALRALRATVFFLMRVAKEQLEA
jgi:hypothetical protein